MSTLQKKWLWVLIFILMGELGWAKAELKFYFPFEEGEGEVTEDKVSGLEGNIQGAEWVEGKIGKALYFDGKEKGCSYIGFPETKDNDFFQNFEDGPLSISLWIKPDSTKEHNKQQEILNTGSDRGPGWRLNYIGKMIRFLSGNGQDYWIVSSDSVKDKVILDDWNHIAVIRNKEGILSLYLNGKKVSQTLIYFAGGKLAYKSETVPFEITNANYPLTIGSYKSGYAYGVKGAIDEVKFYKGELTTEEIYKESQKKEIKLSIQLDGNLNEDLWKNAKKYSPFYLLNSDKITPVQTGVLFNYDNEYLYFAYICDEPKVSNLKKERKENNVNVYLDDCIELMLDSDNNKADYYQILINPLGYYGVLFRTQSGYVSSPVLSFPLFAGTNIEKDKWVVEIAIPYSSITLERIKEEISFNFARDRRVNLEKIEESTLAQKGQFHQPFLFTSSKLSGIDLSPYAFTFSFPLVKDVICKDNKIEAKISSIIKNLSKGIKELNISIGEEKLGILSNLNLSLSPSEEKEIILSFSVPKTFNYDINFIFKEKNKIVYNSTFQLKIEYAPLTIELISPFYNNSIYATQKVEEIKAKIKIGLKEEEYKGSELILSLNKDNKEITSKKYSLKEKEEILSFPIPSLQDGKYEFNANLIKENKTIAEQKTSIFKLPPAKGNEIYIDENLCLILNGKPFLPIIWWAGAPFEEIAKTGPDGMIVWNKISMDELQKINQYAVFGMGGSKITEFWIGKNTLSKEAKDYISDLINSVKEHPALLFYYLVDEPEGRAIDPGILEESYNLIKELDLYHPVLICNDRVHGLYTYKDALDMFFPDPYICPLNNGKLTRPMTYISNFMEEAKKAGQGKKMIGITPQVFDYGQVYASKPPYDTRNNRAPTFVEERCMQYLAIIHGAKGFNYYVYNGRKFGAKNYPDLIVGIPYLIKEIKSLSNPILIGKEIKEVKASNPEIHILLKEEKNHIYLFTCNVTDKFLNVEFSLPGEINELKVVSEGRKIKVNNNKFSDQFVPYDVHIYTANLDFPENISLKKVKEEIISTGGIYEFKYN